MSSSTSSFNTFQRGARRGVSVSSESLVEIGDLGTAGGLPVVIRPRIEGIDSLTWAREHRELLEEKLAVAGGVLLRGFRFAAEEDLESLINALYGDLLEYSYRSTPRTRLSGRIYTSTEYPPDQSIPFHNEMSYSTHWPRRIFFLSIQPAVTGGETPIADGQRVYDEIDPELRTRFEEKRVLYVRNYGGGVDLPWQEVFQTSDPAEVERFCAEAGIEVQWLDGDRLRTRQVCQSVLDHPETGRRVWFNQAHLFHVSSLDPELRASLLASFGEEGLPRNTYYGDGSRIEDASLDEVRRAYSACEVAFPWQTGDVLILDNLRVAHARRPFSGRRKLVVGMAGLTGEAA